MDQVTKDKESHAKDLNATGRKATVAVDLDGTLAEYHNTWGAPIGKPIFKMLTRIYKWKAEGKRVVIFTARAEVPEQIPIVKAWLEPLGLEDLEITNRKTLDIVEFWDDRAIQVIPNTGERADGKAG